MTSEYAAEPHEADIVFAPAPQLPNVAQTSTYTDADWQVRPETIQEIADSIPENTTRAYARVRQDFETWCEKRGRVALPATTETFTEYIRDLIQADVAPTSVSQSIGAIRSMHSVRGFDGQPGTKFALQLLRDHKRRRAANGKGKQQAKPLYPEDIERMVDCLDLAKFVGVRNQLILTLGYSLMMRRSELAALRLADVEEAPGGLKVTIRTSKTDKDSDGEVRGAPPASHVSVCPVQTHRAYRAKLAELVTAPGLLDPETPLLRSVTRWGGPRRSAIPDRVVDDVVKALAVAIGLPQAHRYSAHSLRAGAATAALRKGVPQGIVADHGRWAKTSTVLNEYARTADLFRDNAMRGVL